MMNGVYTYRLDGNLYINLTNKCSNACEFCVRNGKDGYYGNPLWLKKEPTPDEVLKSIDFNKSYGEVVFCGFGEPTYRIKELTEVAVELKKRGFKTRLNTNGQGSIINGRDITGEISKCIDTVNVSLNAPSAEEYQSVCHSVYGKDVFAEILNFAVKCKERGIKVIMSVVDCIGQEKVNRCRELSIKYGLDLKVRKTIKDS